MDGSFNLFSRWQLKSNIRVLFKIRLGAATNVLHICLQLCKAAVVEEQSLFHYSQIPSSRKLNEPVVIPGPISNYAVDHDYGTLYIYSIFFYPLVPQRLSTSKEEKKSESACVDASAKPPRGRLSGDVS
jgi:hypothetical protein